MTINELHDKYNGDMGRYTVAREAIRAQIEKREAQIRRLVKKRDRLVCPPSWIEALVRPIAESLVKKMPNRYFDILGPFGLTSETSIHFYRKGVPYNRQCLGTNCLSISFRPVHTAPDRMEIAVVDGSKNTIALRPSMRVTLLMKYVK